MWLSIQGKQLNHVSKRDPGDIRYGYVFDECSGLSSNNVRLVCVDMYNNKEEWNINCEV